MPDPSLVEKVVLLDRTLKGQRIPHAFGGALALAYYGEPRATVDIDLNVFTGPDQFEHIIEVLGAIGVESKVSPAVVARDGQVRAWWGRTPIDLFFSYDPIHGAMRDRSRLVPFAGTRITILGPEHLVVAKVVFNRAKDWIDIEQMLIAVPSLDMVEIDRWLNRLIGPDDERAQHVRDLEARLVGHP
jgi:hypothetical protein